jgi:hypothetical protein
MEGIKMKISRISIIAFMLVVIAVAIAGCSSTAPATPTTGGTPAATTAPQSGTTAAPTAGSAISGANIFGTASPYNWIEYKMTSSGITIYTKYEKSGKCTVRMVGEGLPSGGMTQDCTATGQQQKNPSEVSSDVTYTFVGIEPVSVPAGTYPVASKYTSTSQGMTATFWTAPGVPGFVKVVSGDATIELNGWG